MGEASKHSDEGEAATRAGSSWAPVPCNGHAEEQGEIGGLRGSEGKLTNSADPSLTVSPTGSSCCSSTICQRSSSQPWKAENQGMAGPL